jgi:radical SAM protein with 4Fe4S-binding SPASM domain
MSGPFLSFCDINDFPLWKELEGRRFPLSFDLELTARCNNACGHCYINLPAGDTKALAEELSLEEINRITDEAVSMGALSCLITGGEPLLRGDFPDIYLSLKKKGLLVSVFTNATLITPDHIGLFREYPPRNIEVTVYGVTEETYEAVTQTPGSFSAFMRGLDSLLESGIKVRLKAMALRSNAHELPQISAFCRKRTKDFFRFDPFLHLRFDRDEGRNAMIKKERLSTEEIVAIEKSDEERFGAILRNCDYFIMPSDVTQTCEHIFKCGAGNYLFVIGCNGFLRLCSSLWNPELMYDLKKGSLREAWDIFIPGVLAKRSLRREYKENCAQCPIINLCLWCPAHAYLETGELDLPVESFCRIAQARARSIEEGSRKEL